MDPIVLAQIKKAIETNEVLLFMKGTRGAPSCGFSARTVEVLESLLSDFSTVDVLAHPEVREGIKEFSSWPTIPQLYVNGKFVGGADIVGEMFESGNLHEILGVASTNAAPPRLNVTDSAKTALLDFIGDSGEIVLLEIDREFSPALSIGPAPAQVLMSEANGVKIGMDRLSATRADGLTIDYVETKDGAAFKLDNPNEPPRVKELSVDALKQKLDSGETLCLIDVRRPDEWETARISGARLLDSDFAAELAELPKDACLIFQCHHGHRSQRAAEQYVAQGFRNVFNLTGGIDAWSRQIDSTVPTY